MARLLFGGSSDDYVVDTAGRPVASRRIRFYTDATRTTEITDLASDAAGTGSPLTVLSDTHGFWPAVYGPDAVSVMYAGAVDSSGNPPAYVVAVYTHTQTGGGGGGAGVSSFNTRAGAVSLTKADVTGTGLAKADLGLGNVDNTADTAKPVSTAQATADTAVQTAAAADVTSRAALKANNLSDLANAATARTNLGLGSAATQSSTAFDAAGAATAVQTNLTAEVARAQNAEAAITNGLKNTQAAVVATSNQALTGLPTIDGVTLTAGQVILLTGQTAGSQNGLWTVGSGAWARPAFFAVGSDATGTNCWVESGTVNGSSSWVVTGTTNNVVGTNVLTWQQVSGLGEVTVTSDLTKTGNQLGLAATAVAAGSYTAANVTVDAKGRVTAASNGASLPTQTGNAGKYLTTDGSSASWDLLAQPVTTIAAAGASQALALPADGVGVWDVTLSAVSCALTFTGATAGRQCVWTLYLRQDATGSRLVTWPTIKWPGNVVPTLSTGANRVDTVTIVSDDGGATFFGYYAGAAGIPASIATAKGDLIAATAAASVTNVAVGTDGQVLTADAASAAGVKWASAPSAAAPMTLTGTTDAVQLTVKANATQTSDIVKYTSSTGASTYMRLDPSGNLGVAGAVQVGLVQLKANNAGALTTSREWHIQAGSSPNQIDFVESGVAERMRISAGGDISLQMSGAALATSAVLGFTHLPNMAGTPSGTPTRSYTGATPVVVDTTGSKLWAYIGGAWKSVTLA